VAHLDSLAENSVHKRTRSVVIADVHNRSAAYATRDTRFGKQHCTGSSLVIAEPTLCKIQQHVEDWVGEHPSHIFTVSRISAIAHMRVSK
jgi:hypothetical protein